MKSTIKKFISDYKILWLRKMLPLLAIILISGYTKVQGATITSSKTGDWSSTSTWVGSKVPLSSDDVTIASGHTITLVDNSGVCKSLIVSNTAILTIGSSSTTITVSGNVSGTGTLKGYSSGGTKKTLTVTFTGNWSFSGSVTNQVSTTINGSGDQTLNGSFAFRSISVNKAGGTCFITGSPTVSSSFTVSSGNVNYSASGAQTISPTSFPGNLTLSGSGTKTFSSTTTITGNLTITGAVADLGSKNHTAQGLYFGIALQNGGTWGGGGSGSTATNYTNSAFTTSRTGILTIPVINSWTGVTNTDWSIATNWSAGSKPISTDDVIIPNVTNKPIIGATAVCKSMTINPSSSLTISGANTLTVSADWTNNGAFTDISGTVIFSGAAQTIAGSSTTTFNNVTVSGTGAKTLTKVFAVNGILSMEGSSTSATLDKSPTYNAFATLQYNKSASFTSGSEWPSTFTATGGVIITGSGAITLGGSKTFNLNIPLTINASATLTPSSKNLSFSGNFINNGTYTSGSGNVTIAGTGTQSIGKFTTSATVSMTKTAGVATFTGNVSGKALTINGPGGTLNLGTGLTHTFSGTYTQTAGTLDGGSGTVSFSSTNTPSITGGTFNRNTGTVNYSGAAQTVAPLTYNNLTLSGGSNAKTFPTGTTTVNGVLSIENGTNANTFTGTLVYGSAATLQYNSATSARTVSTEWPATFSGSGGVIIKGTGLITLNASKTLNTGVPLTINSGSKLSTSSSNYGLTLGGNFTNSGGTFTANGSAITINGTTTAQTISGFTTTGAVTIGGTVDQSIAAFTSGAVSMTKTGGTATLTGNMSGTSLTLNGSGGTLYMGSSRTHTFSGDITLTAGTLDGGLLTTINANSTSSTAWNGDGTTFIPGTSTVVLGGTNQTLGASSPNFYNLTFTGASSTKTITNALTVSNNLSIGTATSNTTVVLLPNGTTSSTKVLKYGTTTKTGGSYGGTSSTAANPNSTYFGSSTTGIINSSTDQRLLITGSTSTVAGSPINITITAKEADGITTFTSYTGDKTLTFSGANSSSSPVTAPTIKDKSGVARAFGTATTITFTNGVATVSGSNNGAMALYKAEDAVISATDGTLSSTGSDRLFVTVSAAVANNLAFTTQPGSGNNSSVWATQPIVTILDVYGNIVTGGIARSIALAIGNNPSTGTLSGTTSMNTSNGMTAYSDLSINKGGTGYTLIASTSGITSATSDPFDISNPAPTVSGISPNLVCAGGGSFTLAILGTNFNPQSVVLFNGLSRAITLQTDIELEVTILAGDIANGGTPSITVVNPTPGGGTSSGSTLTVSQIVITPSVTQPSCFADGSISLTVDGGTAPYNYDWADIVGTANSKDRTGLKPTTYSVTVTDANGCSAILSRELVAATGCTGITVCKSDAASILSVPPDPANTSYTWTLPSGATINSGESTGSISVNWTGVEIGGYEVSVVAHNICGESLKSSILVYVLQPSALATADLACLGGTLNLYASGGVSYSWSGPNSYTSQDPNPVIYNIASGHAGTYTVTVTNSAGCSATASVPVTVNTPPTVASNTITSSTFGNSTGAITLSVSGGSGFTYAWSAKNSAYSAASMDISGIPSDNYTITASNSTGCSTTKSFPVSNSDGPIATATPTNVTCNGSDNGSIILSDPTGGTGSGYTYSWSGPNDYVSTDQNPTLLAPGDYSVIITDGGANEGIASTTVTESSALQADGIVTNINCFGGSTGAVSITVSGGTANASAPYYSYAWTGPGGFTATSQNISGRVAGDYSCTITDNNDCTLVKFFTIAQPSAIITATPTITNVSCNGGSTGQVVLAVSGGTAPYTYAWSGPSSFTASTKDISGRIAGTYTVTITDSKNCALTLTGGTAVVISQPDALSLTITSQTNVNCKGGSNGAIDLSVTGGTSPYTYVWSNGHTEQDLSSLTAGIYSVIVTDAHGCTETTSATITEPEISLSASISSHVNVLCNGNSTGTATAAGAGGTVGSGYSYSWNTSPIQTNATATGLSAGVYTVTITDSKGCTSVANASITEASVLSVSGSVTNVLCNGASSGAIDITVSGGATPYKSYNWNSGASTSEDRTALVAGNYQVLVTDNNDCPVSASFAVTQSPALSLTGTIKNVNCKGGSDGSIGLAVSGGASPYTFAWTGTGGFTSTTQDINSIPAGTYSVTVTDDNECTATLGSQIVGEPSVLLLVVATPIGLTCNSGNNGSISVVASGGTGTYTYAWSTGASGTSIGGLIAGTYGLLVTDEKGCTATPSTESLTVTEPSTKMELYAIPKNSSSCGTATGSIDLSVVNGISPYTYAWTNTAQTIQDPLGLAANTYKATVTDYIGCSATLDVTVGTAAALSVSVTTYPKTCLGTDGSAYSVVTGGVEPFTYLWSNGATNQNITSLDAGVFTVTVTDANGCSAGNTETVASASCAAPLVTNDNFLTNYNTMLTSNVGSNDSDPDAASYPGSELEYFIMTQPSAAQGTMNWGTNYDGSFTFTPSAGYAGTFSLKYKVFDVSGLSSEGTLTITVGPKACDDPIGTSMNTPVLGDVKTNDFYEPGSSFTKLTDPAKGVVTFNADGTYNYTPNTSATGDDSFTYSVCLSSPNAAVCSTGTVLISIDGSADLGITNVPNTGTPNVGGNVTLTLTATNNGPNMALGVSATNKLPSGYAYVSDNGAGKYNPITGKWTIGTLANSASTSLQIVAKVNATGVYINPATVTGTNRDPVLANNGASCTTVPVPQSDISIVATSNNPAQMVGQDEIFTLTVTNNGPSDALGVNASDALPDGFIFVTNSTPSSGTFNSGSGAWTIGNLAYEETATMTITAKVNSTGSYSNTATVNSTTNDPTLANNSSTVVAAPGASADLKVESSVNKASAYIGSYVEFTITATNILGLSSATGVIVNDLLPSGYTFVSDDAAGDCNPVTGDWTIGNLASGAARVLKVLARVNASGTVVNTATIGTSDMPDPNQTNDSASSLITVIPVADLSVTNSVNVDVPVYDSDVVFTITVTNNGPSTSAGVVVTGLLPSGYIWISDDGTGSYTNGTGVWTVGGLANGASKTLNITAKVKSTGDYITTAVASATTADLTTDNNTANKTTAPIPIAVSNLTVSDGILVGNFAKDTYSYTDYVPYTVSSMTVTPTFEENNPSITVCISQSESSCSSPSAVASGSPSQQLNLQVGDNWITTVVTSPGPIVKTYKIKVTRADLPTPDVQATNILLSLVSPTSISVDWTNGNGAKRLVFIREAISLVSYPVNNTTYTASTSMYNAGSQIGTSGTYCIYNGTGSSVDMTNLKAKTDYVVEVFEYNGEMGYTKVNTTTATGNPMNGSTPYQLAINSPSDFAAGNRVSYVVTRQFADGTPVSVSATEQSVYLYASGTTGSFYDAANGVTPIYRVVIPAGATSANFWFTATKPGGYVVTASDKFLADGNTGLIDATDLINVTTTPSQYLVISSAYTAYGSGQVTITAQLADLFGNPIALNDQIVTWSSTNLGVFGSPTSTTNGSGIAMVTYTVSPTVGTQHTATATTGPVTGTSNKITVVEDPTLLVQAHDITFTNTKGTHTNIGWTKGTGTQRVVFMKQVSSGTTAPVNNTVYTASSNFGDGTQIPTGWYCVYDGTGSSITVTGLTPQLDYEVQVFEYKGSGGFEQYNPSAATLNPNKVTTKSNNFDLISLVPSVGVLSPVFAPGTTSYTESVASSVTEIAVTPTATKNSSTITVEEVPVISGQQSLFKTLVTGVNTITTVVTAQDGTTKTYTIMIVKAADTAPTEQAHDISFSSVTTTGMSVNWSNGNGTSRAVFIKQASTGVAFPIDNATYTTATTTYNSGSQIGSTGWYCIYNGTGNGPVAISGLSAGTDYIVKAFEYNGATDAAKFNTSAAVLNPNTQKTTVLINEWIGALDQDWFKPVNWNLNIVPTTNDNVNIRNIGSYPEYGYTVSRYPQIFDLKVSGVYQNRKATCNDLSIAPLASLTVMQTGKFDVGGNITNNHTADSLGLVVKSSVIGTGSMIVKGTITGPGTVERFTDDEYWYLVSPPAIQKVKDFLKLNIEIPYWQDLDGDPSTLTDQYALAEYLPLTNKWDVYFRDSNMAKVGDYFYNKYLDAGSAYKTMTSHKPYVSLSDPITSILTFKGSINVGEELVYVKGNNTWNCVGNPFTSAICLNASAGAANNGADDFLNENIDAPANPKGIDRNYAAVYFWDSSVTSYQVLNKSDVGPKYAQVGQGFFVKGTINDEHINFTPAMQVHQTALQLKTEVVEAPQILLNAVFGKDKYATKIRFIEGMTDGLDVGYDAGLFRPATGFAIYTKLVRDNGVDFQLQCLPTKQYKDLMVPVGVESKAAGEVVFSAVGTNLEAGCKMILEDRLTHIFTDLSINTYKAAVTANTATSDRFFLHASEIISAIGDQKLSTSKLTAYAVRNDEIRVIGEVTDKAVATLYNGLGKVVLTRKLGIRNLNIIGLPNLSSGIYMLNIIDKGTSQTIKILIR